MIDKILCYYINHGTYIYDFFLGHTLKVYITELCYTEYVSEMTALTI